MDPFRKSAGRCGLCKVEVDTAELQPLAGIEACERCRTGDISAAIEAQGFVEEHKRYHFHSVAGGGSGWQLKVEMRRPTRVEIVARFWAEPGFDNWFTRLFRKPERDPEVGIEDFDRAVHIKVDDAYHDNLMALLAAPGVREAVVWLVGHGCVASLTFSEVSAGARVWAESSLPDLDEVIRHVVALGVHLERFARTAAS